MTKTGDHNVDLLVIGGGINGVGRARDAAGRGLKVLLCDKGDLGGATSSASSKLIHGGLRYLENYEFRLVREALAEREVLLRIAPHITHPLRFVLPHDSSSRPAWMIRIGLFLYDHLARRSRLGASRRLDLRRDPAGALLKPTITTGFSYYDGWVDDSRLVVLNAMDAAARGATILPRWACGAVKKQGRFWQADLTAADGRQRTVSARILVNAAGPWAGEILHKVTGRRDPLRLVKGSHIIVRSLYAGDHAYILQNDDRRIVFTIPFGEDFTVIGTTDIAFTGDPDHVMINDSEIDYLCAAVNRWFEHPLKPADAVSHYAGVRPLVDDDHANPSAVTRDYVFDVEGGGPEPVLLSVFGGKLTTYRRLAEHALEKLSPFLPGLPPAWTADAALPGGDIPNGDIDAFRDELCSNYSWLPRPVAVRYAHAYGSRAHAMLLNIRSLAEMGQHFGAGLYEREVAYLVEHEWAAAPDDILWRRTKIGLHADTSVAAGLAQWFDQHARPSLSAASTG